MRVLELYSGIGGLAAALKDVAPATQVVAALDVNHLARQVYALNFPHPSHGVLIEFVDRRRLQDWQADLWWMSPPCQPFTRRGRQRDAEDPRAQTFLKTLQHFASIRPPYLALENVATFRGSQVHHRLLRMLDACGYVHRHEIDLCPGDFGWLNRRPRYYLVAGRQALAPWVPPTFEPPPWDECVDPSPEADLFVDDALLQRYAGALHIVDVDDPKPLTRTFTSAYGRSPVRSGSYVRQGGAVRRFSPREILRQLDFPATFRLPRNLSRRKAWQLVGNSLSLPAVRAVLRSIPDWA